MSLIRLLLGRRLATREQKDEKIGIFAGLPALGLDGLSSAAYGPEAALAILVPLGAAGLAYIGPITLVILGLLAVLYFSYRQTIAAYPLNGGSYTVAKENLGVWASLFAAAALMIDYVLTVAVGISAGVAALTSAFPQLQRFTVPACIAILALITIINLRGTGEAGVAFAVPTYLFISTLLIVLIIGMVRTLLAHGHPVPSIAPAPSPAAIESVSLWLLLRSFASGCTAMTGVEAVSNGVSAFKEPQVKNAHLTLTAIVGILSILLGGMAYLARAYGITAMDENAAGYQSLLSQLVSAIVGRGWFYYLTMAAVLAVLCLSANTSFVDFPRLCRLIAKDEFLPCYFAAIGRRLVYSTGVLFLAVASGLLLVGFKGITDDLIPLYAVGAFLAFTLSQSGMVVYWNRRCTGNPADAASPAPNKSSLRLRQAVNAIGAVATATALTIILLAKFAEGAWITVLTIPILLVIFKSVHHHYKLVEGLIQSDQPLALDHNLPPVVLLPIRGWTRPVQKALRFAATLSPDVVALHLTQLEGDEADDEETQVRAMWAKNVETPTSAAHVPSPRLEFVQTPYREFTKPLMEQIDILKDRYPQRLITVLLPELIEKNWLESLLHTHRSLWLRRRLRERKDYHVLVLDIPWFVEIPHRPERQCAIATGPDAEAHDVVQDAIDAEKPNTPAAKTPSQSDGAVAPS
jgi:amino acid transporter